MLDVPEFHSSLARPFSAYRGRALHSSASVLRTRVRSGRISGRIPTGTTVQIAYRDPSHPSRVRLAHTRPFRPYLRPHPNWDYRPDRLPRPFTPRPRPSRAHASVPAVSLAASQLGLPSRSPTATLQTPAASVSRTRVRSGRISGRIPTGTTVQIAYRAPSHPGRVRPAHTHPFRPCLRPHPNWDYRPDRLLRPFTLRPRPSCAHASVPAVSRAASQLGLPSRSPTATLHTSAASVLRTRVRSGRISGRSPTGTTVQIAYRDPSHNSHTPEAFPVCGGQAATAYDARENRTAAALVQLLFPSGRSRLRRGSCLGPDRHGGGVLRCWWGILTKIGCQGADWTRGTRRAVA